MRVIVGCLLLVLTALVVLGQKPEDATRKLWDTAFISSPTNKKSAHRRRGAYRVATPNVPTDNVVPDSVVGVTIWRLRPANRSDSGERLIVHDDDAVKEWMPERNSANNSTVQGDRK